MHFVRLTTCLLLTCGLTPLSSVGADVLSRSLAASSDNIREEAVSQQRIDRLDEETQRMLDDYQSASRELETLTAYNDQLARLVDSQEGEKTSVRQQMQDIETTQREIAPLMLNMLARLEELAAVEQPFLEEERAIRVEQLRTLMDRADVSVGEKYRRIMEAYQIELEYGRTLEVYSGVLSDAAGQRTVNFLRTGRLAIYYQTPDGRESGYWDRSSRGWVTLPSSDNAALRDGMRIARKQAAPELIRLPVPAARDLP